MPSILSREMGYRVRKGTYCHHCGAHNAVGMDEIRVVLEMEFRGRKLRVSRTLVPTGSRCNRKRFQMQSPRYSAVVTKLFASAAAAIPLTNHRFLLRNPVLRELFRYLAGAL